jgi:hypothetical protein
MSQGSEDRGQGSEKVQGPGSRVEIVSHVPLPDGLWFKAEGTFELKIEVVNRESGDPGLDIFVYHNGKLQKTLPRMCKGDRFTINHAWSSKGGPVAKPHFPLEIYWKGQKYLLNETKGGKLLLTK